MNKKKIQYGVAYIGHVSGDVPEGLNVSIHLSWAEKPTGDIESLAQSAKATLELHGLHSALEVITELDVRSLLLCILRGSEGVSIMQSKSILVSVASKLSEVVRIDLTDNGLGCYTCTIQATSIAWRKIVHVRLPVIVPEKSMKCPGTGYAVAKSSTSSRHGT